MSNCHRRNRPSIDDLIQQLQDINLRNQEAEQEENRLQEERLRLRAEGARLTKQLAVAQAVDHQLRDEAVMPIRRSPHEFAMGDRVVIDNPSPMNHGRAFDPADWQGVVI